jgi:hypothetical protein
MLMKTAIDSETFDLRWLEKVCNYEAIPSSVALEIIRNLTFA